MQEKCLNEIRKVTKHKYVKFLNSGNMAIFSAFFVARQSGVKTIIIPDQGGWLTYRTYPSVLGLETKYLKTKDSLIELNILEDTLKKTKNAALIFTGLGGYFVEQPLKGIAELCKKHKCIMIEDASGSIFVEGLCDGNLSDLIVGSFGDDKIVNLGYGGFISAKGKEMLQEGEEIFTLRKISPDFYNKLFEKLKSTPERLDFLFKTNKKIKQELKGFDIVHKNSRSVNVVIRFKNEDQKNKIIEYCEKNKYPYEICPRYIRLEDKAVSIEVKKIRG